MLVCGGFFGGGGGGSVGGGGGGGGGDGTPNPPVSSVEIKRNKCFTLEDTGRGKVPNILIGVNVGERVLGACRHRTPTRLVVQPQSSGVDRRGVGWCHSLIVTTHGVTT